MAREKSKDAAGGARGPGLGLGLEIHCHGQFYYKTQERKGTRVFEQVVKAPSLEVFRETSYKYLGMESDEKRGTMKPKFRENSFINVRGQLKRRILPLFLRKQHNDFVSVRFVVIDEIISLDGSELDLPIQLRSREQLAKMVEREHIPVDPGDYTEIDELRTDILEYTTDPAMFLATKERRDKRRTLDRQLLEMNELEPGSVGPRREPKPVVPAGAGQAGIENL